MEIGMKKTVIPALLILLTNAFSSLPAQSQAPVAGTDYIEIPNGAPLESADGMVVVEEFFNYICPGCNAFEPYFIAWISQLPPHVKVAHVPAAFRADFVPYARAFYAADSLGLVDETHQAVYNAIHRSRSLPAEGDKPDEQRIAEFYASYGVDAEKFLATMKSFGVDFKIRRATEHMRVSKIPSTPSIVVNGRYLVRGRTYDDMLRIADFLIEKEHSGT
jgi:protein dithiol oxidoreductase (disulfide-forming)